MDLDLLVLVALAVYRGTLLVTGDRITRTPRRRLRAWLHDRAHHLVAAQVGVRVCSCDWRVEHVPAGGTGPLRTILVHGTDHDLVPRSAVLPPHTVNPTQAEEYLESLSVRHVREARDRGHLSFLLECPWCVSIYLGAVGAAVANTWPAGWWRWPALALAASGVTGLLATIAAPDDNDEDD